VDAVFSPSLHKLQQEDSELPSLVIGNNSQSLPTTNGNSTSDHATNRSQANHREASSLANTSQANHRDASSLANSTATSGAWHDRKATMKRLMSSSIFSGASSSKFMSGRVGSISQGAMGAIQVSCGIYQPRQNGGNTGKVRDLSAKAQWGQYR
jgi:hypothetical protein